MIAKKGINILVILLLFVSIFLGGAVKEKYDSDDSFNPRLESKKTTVGDTYPSNTCPSETFNRHIPYAKKWLLISATTRSIPLQCKKGLLLQSSCFANLEPDFYICVSEACETKEEALGKQAEQKSKESYIRYSGSYSDIPWPAPKHSDLLFITALGPVTGIECAIQSDKADDIYAEQGIDSVVTIVYTAIDQLKGLMDTLKITAVSLPEFTKTVLDSTNTAITAQWAEIGASVLHISVWHINGKLIFNQKFYSEADQNEYEYTHFEKRNDSGAIITRYKSKNEKEQLSIKSWNGKTFK